MRCEPTTQYVQFRIPANFNYSHLDIINEHKIALRISPNNKLVNNLASVFAHSFMTPENIIKTLMKIINIDNVNTLINRLQNEEYTIY